jgi:hypothetical protein
MKKDLAALEQTQEEFQAPTVNCLEDLEDEMQVCKMDVDVFRIQLSSMEKDVKDVEMSVDNSHLRLEKLEDWVDGFIESIWRTSTSCQANVQLLGLEIQRVQRESHADHECLLGKFVRTNDIINKKFVQLDMELEKVVDLVGQKIKTGVGSIASDFAEATEIEETWFASAEAKVMALEEKLEPACEEIPHLSGVMVILQGRVGELEDVVMEDASDADAEGDTVVSTSSSEFDPVENTVAIPIPPPVIHTLIPVEVSEAFIPLSLRTMPSPPYVADREEDPVHDGIPEYWADLGAGLS